MSDVRPGDAKGQVRPITPLLRITMLKFIEALLDIIAPILRVLDRNGKL